MPIADVVIVFARYPEAGRVKTRLARSIGAENAVQLYRCFVEDTLGKTAGRSWRTEIHFTPEESYPDFQNWLGTDRVYVPQRGANLGERMMRAFEDCFDRGAERAVLIGADLPDLPGEFLGRGFEQLDEMDLVLGPSADGGYYLIGFAREGFEPAVFEGIEWGTGQVLMQTIARIHKSDKSAGLLPRWQDVDTAADLADLRQRCESGTGDCPRTMQWLACHF